MEHKHPFYNQLLPLLAPIGTVKACLADDTGRALLDSFYSVKEMRDNDFFLFQKLEQHTSSHKNQSDLSFERSERTAHNAQCLSPLNIAAVVLIAPENLLALVSELAAPSFSEYHVFFIGEIGAGSLEALASADSAQLVARVEILRFTALLVEHGVWLRVPAQRPANEIAETTSLNTRSSLIDGAASSLALAIKHASAETSPVTCTFSRTADPLTMLIPDWHYQTLLHEYFSCGSGVARLGSLEVPLNDFYEAARQDTLPELLERIHRELDACIANASSPADGLEGYKAYVRANTLRLHLEAHNVLATKCIENAKLADAIHGILKKKPVSLPSLFKDFDADGQLRLALIYLLLYATEWMSAVAKLKPYLSDEKAEDIIWRFYKKYVRVGDVEGAKGLKTAGGSSKMSVGVHTGDNSQTTKLSKAFLKIPPYKPVKFRKGVDKKLGYEAPLQRAVRRLSEVSSFLIIISGGITPAEISVVQNSCKNVHILADKIVSFSRFLEEVRSEAFESIS